MSGWIAYHRSEEAEELQSRHPNAFLLLAQIARRARWSACPITGLQPGQALVGDWKKAGIPSEMAYRHAKEILEKCGLSTFQGTTRGTIATLVSTSVFSLSELENNERGNGPRNDRATDKERTNNGQATTNVQRNKDTKNTRKQSIEIPSELSSPAFGEAWEKWSEHRSEIRKPLKPTSANQQLKKLAQWGEARAIEAILYSIEKGWTGIFEPKVEGSGSGMELNLGGRRRHVNSLGDSTSLEGLEDTPYVAPRGTPAARNNGYNERTDF